MAREIPEDSRIGLFQPQSAEDIYDAEDDIALLLQNLDDVDEDIMRHMAEHPERILLFYLDGEIALGVGVNLNKHSVQLHGVVRKGYEHSGITNAVVPVLLDNCFETWGKKKVIVRVPEDNRGAKAFAWRWGFRKIQRSGKDNVYQLTKQDYERHTRELWQKGT